MAFSTADFLSDGSMIFNTNVLSGSDQSSFAFTLNFPCKHTDRNASDDAAAISTGVCVLSASATT